MYLFQKVEKPLCHETSINFLFRQSRKGSLGITQQANFTISLQDKNIFCFKNSHVFAGNHFAQTETILAINPTLPAFNTNS